jgi:hypothetical protein
MDGSRGRRIQRTTTSEIQIRANGTGESVKVTHPIFRIIVETALKPREFEPIGKALTQAVTVRFSPDDGGDNIRSSDTDAYNET